MNKLVRHIFSAHLCRKMDKERKHRHLSHYFYHDVKQAVIVSRNNESVNSTYIVDTSNKLTRTQN